MYSNASPPKQRAMRLLGTVAGLALGGFAAIWLFADQASGKLAIILWGTACVAGLWLAAISWWGRKRGTTLAISGTIILSTVAALAQLLGTPSGGDDTSVGPSTSALGAPNSVPSSSPEPSRSPSTPRSIVPFPPQQPPAAERSEKAWESDSISGLPAPNVPCLQGCRDLQLSEGQDFDIDTWRTADDTSNDIAVGKNSLHDYMLRPLNGAGIQPIPNIPAGALDAADCPTGGYSTDVIPIPPTIPFCLLTAEGTHVMLMGQNAFNLPFRPFLTSTLRP